MGVISRVVPLVLGMSLLNFQGFGKGVNDLGKEMMAPHVREYLRGDSSDWVIYHLRKVAKSEVGVTSSRVVHQRE